MSKEKQLSLRDEFHLRHIGPRPDQIGAMLQTVGASSLEELVQQTIPSDIRMERDLDLPNALDEYEAWIFKDKPRGNFCLFIDKISGDIFITDFQI